MKTLQINALNGLRNDVSTERFGTGDLLSGKNVDIDETGKVYRRQGTEQLSTDPAYSLWADGDIMLYVQNNKLWRHLPNGSTVELHDSIAMDVAYKKVNENVYLSDGVQALVTSGAACRHWGLEVPTKTFRLSSTVGDMKKGRYGVTIVYLRDGMESGAPRSQFIDLEDNQGIHIANMPVPADPTINGKRIYITQPDGETHYSAAYLDVTDTSMSVFAQPEGTLPLRTQFKGPPPAGHLVSHFNGHTIVCNGDTLFYSDPFEYELFDLRTNFVQFDSQIQIFAPLSEGAFLATETETVFLLGRDPSEWQVKKVAPYGAVRGTLVTPRNDQIGKDGVPDTVALWLSKRGVCVGTSDGQMENLTGDRFVMPAARTGAGLFKVRGGTPQYLVSLFS